VTHCPMRDRWIKRKNHSSLCEMYGLFPFSTSKIKLKITYLITHRVASWLCSTYTRVTFREFWTSQRKNSENRIFA